MKPARSRLCLCCNDPFEADARNAHHQKYCTKPTCRKASKAASQGAWIAKPENVTYHSGAVAVARVRDWQKTHPEYRERQKGKRAGREIALQDIIIPQTADSMTEMPVLPEEIKMSDSPVPPALQDFISLQPSVFVGLIAHFFNITLQDDIASTTRSLQKLGEDIANGRKSDEIFKAGNLYQSRAAGAGAVQLGGSAAGAG
jgi:hypothetical protein